MKITVHKGTVLPDTTTDIYIGTNIKDNFSDIRFTKLDGITPLNYWIESISEVLPNISAVIWIKTNPQHRYYLPYQV